MAFVSTVLYIVFSLLSPGVLPDAIRETHVNIILSIFAILSCLPSFARSRLGLLPDIYLLLLLLVASAIAMILTGWMGGVLENFGQFVPIVMVFPFVVISCGSLSRVRLLVLFLVFVGLFIFSQGVLADLNRNYESPYLLTQRFGDGPAVGVVLRYRGLGVLADPNDLAQLLVTLTPLLWLRWKKGAKVSNFFFTLLPAATLLVAIYYTHSRGAIVGLVALLWFALKDRLGVTASSVTAALALGAMLLLNVSGGRALDDDDGGRVAAWATGLEVFKTHPVFGVGMGNFSNFNDTGLTAHNSYVLCLAEVGVIGYFAWMGLIVMSWNGLSRMVKLKRTAAAAPGTDEPDVLGRVSSAPSLPVPYVSQTVGPPGFGNLAIAHPYPSPVLASSVTSSGDISSSYLTGRFDLDQRPSDEELAWAAHIIQLAMVGLLATCFFLSRTYSMPLYVMLGLATALRLIEGRGRGDLGIEPGTFRRVGWVVVCSIIFLYIFVRVQGMHR